MIMKLTLLLCVTLLLFCPYSMGMRITDDFDDPVNTTCGGVYADAFGSVQSPNFPDHYSSNIHCEYLFRAPSNNQVVSVTFQDFLIDEDENSENCVFDRVIIHDGPDATYPSIGRAMCGSKIPEQVFSSGPHLTISLHSSVDSVFGKGFQLNYNMVDKNLANKKCKMNVCGGHFNDFEGCEIQSPNYPITYFPNQDCTWIFQAPNPTDRYEVDFDVFMVEYSFKCSENNVTLIDGLNADDKVIGGPMCNNRHGSIYTNKKFFTTGPSLRLSFKTSSETIEDRNIRTSEMDHLSGMSAHIKLIPGPTTTTIKLSPTTTTTSTTKAPTTTTTSATTTTAKAPVKPENIPEKTTGKIATEPQSKTPVVDVLVTNETGTDANQSSGSKIPASAMSGLVIGVIVGLFVIILCILCVVAYVHWKRQNYRIRLRTEDDQNVLISNMDGEINFRKSGGGGRIVRPQSQNRDSMVNNDDDDNQL